MTMPKYAIGDTVRVFDVNGRRLNMPEDGWEGTVTNVGRKYISVSYNHRVRKFVIETGTVNDRYGHQYIMSDDELRNRRFLASAKVRLSEFNLGFYGTPKLTGENLIKLADLAGKLLAEQGLHRG